MNLPSEQTDSETPRSVPVDLAAVIRAEHEAIAERRRIHNLPSDDGTFKPQNDLVGLALSGGGLRSAMFNLGLLKALHDSGFMKFVDYLSTVSGGGYIGAYYSTLGDEYRIATASQPPVAESKAEAFEPNPIEQSHTQVNAMTRPVSVMNDAELSKKLEEATYRFINGGQYLKQPWIFFTQWICPTLKIFALYVSLLVTVASVIALMFRATDFPVVQDYYRLIGPQSEAGILFLNICIFWALLVVIYGLLVLGVIKPQPDERPAGWLDSLLSDSTIRHLRNLRSQIYDSGMWLKLLIVAVLCGLAIAIGNYDFGLFSGASIKFQSEARLPLILMAAAGLASLLKLPSLLKSEKATATFWQKSIMWVVLSCAVGGGSLAVLTIVGMEGISGYPQRRGATFHREDSLNDRLLATTVMNEITTLPFIADAQPVKEELQRKAKNLLLFTEQLDDSQAKLFPGSAHWVTAWNGVTIWKYPEEWLSRMYGWATGDGRVPEYRQLSDDCRASRQRLFNDINVLFFNTSGTTTLNVDEKLANTSTQITQCLLAAFQQRVLEDRVGAKQAESLQLTLSGLVSTLAGAVGKGNETEEKSNAEAKTSSDGENANGNNHRLSREKKLDFHSQLEVGKSIESYLSGIVINESPFLGSDNFRYTVLKCLGNDGNLTYQPDMFEYHDELLFRRHLLEATYPQVFKQLAFISSPVVVGFDQETRLFILGLSLLVSVVLCITLDFNQKAALFKFYQERIAKTFIEAGHLNSLASARGEEKNKDRPLSEFTPWKVGFPYPLICAALKLPQTVDVNEKHARQFSANPMKTDGSVGSEWYSFLLSSEFVGYMPVLPNITGRIGKLDQKNQIDSVHGTYRRTQEYLNNSLTVSQAFALSGAAFTPWMSDNSALNLLMHVFNLRLEQWLPNPGDEVCQQKKAVVRLPTIVNEALKCSTPEGLKDWQWGIVADGGFREFLGVEELIARRCRIIVVSDAGCNNGVSEFGVLADLVRKVRLDHKVEILDLDHDLPLDTERMKRSADGRVVQHFIAGRIRYPKDDSSSDTQAKASLYDRTGLFVYVQMSLTGDEDVDLAQFQKINPTFPDEPITNQFFSASQVESLRQLGEHVGKHLCQRLNTELILCEDKATETLETNKFDSLEVTSKMPTSSNSCRIERLNDALISAYLVECRQEQAVGIDDTTREFALDSIGIDNEAIRAFNLFEERGDKSQILAKFVSDVIDGHAHELLSKPDGATQYLSLFKKLRFEPADLAGLAVECNRRHAGFRSENPDRFFRIAGRRLLLRSTSRAIEVCEIFNQRVAPDELASVLKSVLKGVARLAAVLPDGIFRSHRIKTARDLTLCILFWIKLKIIELRHKGQDDIRQVFAEAEPGKDESALGLFHIDCWLYRATFRDGLEAVIATGLASEVEFYLNDVIVQGKTPTKSLEMQLGSSLTARSIDEEAQQPLQVRIST